MKRNRILPDLPSLTLILLFGLITAGCGRLEMGIESTDTIQPAAPQDNPVGTDAAQDDGAVPATQTALPAAHIASGLVLSSPSQTWYVDASGQVVLLADVPRAQLAADHERVLIAKEASGRPMNDIWLIDLATGEGRNLTDTPDRDEVLPSWWLAHPDTVFMVSGQDVGMANAENPTLVGIDGSDYRVLDSEHGGPFSLAPDGSSIAYGGFEPTGWIYRWNEGIESFNPSDYGLQAEKVYQPSWSPDGHFLAWIASGDLQGDGVAGIGLVVFDLMAQDYRLLHFYTPQGGGTVPHYVSWSPDGNWIAYVTFAEAPAAGREANLWVMRPDGSEESFVDVGLEPTWSPNGSKLAYIHSTMQGEIDLRIAQTGSWDYTVVDDLTFPGQAQFIMNWLQP